MAILKIGKTVLGSLFKKPATLMYPVIPREYKERTRGHIEIDIEACILCGICQKKCVTDAITVDRAAKTWSIKRMQCIQCSCCVDVCPKKCLINEAHYTTPDTTKVLDTFEQPEKPATDKTTASSGGSESLKVNDTCVFCGLCVKKCPMEAITVDRKEKSWSVDDSKCTRCGLCVEACPKNSLEIS